MIEPQVQEIALLCSVIALMAVIVYFMIPDRASQRRAVLEESITPSARVYRPLWADRPPSAVVEIDLAAPPLAAAA